MAALVREYLRGAGRSGGPLELAAYLSHLFPEAAEAATPRDDAAPARAVAREESDGIEIVFEPIEAESTELAAGSPAIPRPTTVRAGPPLPPPPSSPQPPPTAAEADAAIDIFPERTRAEPLGSDVFGGYARRRPRRRKNSAPAFVGRVIESVDSSPSARIDTGATTDE
jgi:hypothetical protein